MQKILRNKPETPGHKAILKAFRFNKAHADFIEAMAKKEDITESDYIRKLIYKEMKKQG